MINGNKTIKEMLNESDLIILQKLNLSEDDTLEKAINILEEYNEKEKTKYIELLKKIYDLLPVYGTPTFTNKTDGNNTFDDEDKKN